MKTDLAEFLDSGKCLYRESVSWGAIRLRISSYSSTKPAPPTYVSSARAIVFRQDCVLVITEAHGEKHILPGGRRQKGERPETTLRREILEESGWRISGVARLGFMHLHHLSAKPDKYEYPYPDFIWPIYVANAHKFLPGARAPEETAMQADFLSIADVLRLPLNPGQRALLNVAIGNRG